MNKNTQLQILYTEKEIEMFDFLQMSENVELIEHSREVSQIARMILKNLKNFNVKEDEKLKHILKYMDYNTLANIYELHDLGKIFIPDEILNKPGRLTDQEFHYIYKHPETTKKVLDYVLSASPNDEAFNVLYDTIKLISLEHHENYDGTGYPNKLKGNEISLLGRIARVSDVISALMGTRCYNREFNSFEAISNYLVENKGILFDPEIVDIVINTLPTNGNIISRQRLLDVFDVKNEIKEITKKIKVKIR